MSKDILFLLKPDFYEGPEGPFYCPDCAHLRGLLAYYPRLETDLDVRYVEFARPRRDVIGFTGEALQSCPVLILAAPIPASLDGIEVQAHENHRFISTVEGIAMYLSRTCHVGRPH